MTVSAALIVRDEESTLPTCLDSLVGMVDEIIVTDTGSTDATIEVARQYGARVFSFDWCDDFSAARQFAFDQARGDWIMWCDADDLIIGAAQIRALAASASADVAAFAWKYNYESDPWGNVLCSFWRERLVRRGAFRWVGRVHEALDLVVPGRIVCADDVVVQHQSLPERRPAKTARNLRLLELEYEEAGGNPSERCLYYLARELVAAGQCDRAVTILAHFIEVATDPEERYQALVLVAGLHRQHGDFTAAEAADLQALKDCPGWPQAFYGLAETAYHRQDWLKAVAWSDLGRTRARPETIHIVEQNPVRWIGYYVAALAQLGRIADALQWSCYALTLRPDDEEHRENFRCFAEGILAEPVGRAS